MNEWVAVTLANVAGRPQTLTRHPADLDLVSRPAARLPVSLLVPSAAGCELLLCSCRCHWFHMLSLPLKVVTPVRSVTGGGESLTGADVRCRRDNVAERAALRWIEGPGASGTPLEPLTRSDGEPWTAAGSKPGWEGRRGRGPPKTSDDLSCGGGETPLNTDAYLPRRGRLDASSTPLSLRAGIGSTDKKADC